MAIVKDIMLYTKIHVAIIKVHIPILKDKIPGSTKLCFLSCSEIAVSYVLCRS